MWLGGLALPSVEIPAPITLGRGSPDSLFNGEVYPMSDIRPAHGIFIKWGRFQAGAFGTPAVLTVFAAMVAGFIGRWLGFW
jgi:hypothetical protein